MIGQFLQNLIDYNGHQNVRGKNKGEEKNKQDIFGQ